MKKLSKTLGLIILTAAMALGYAACGNITGAETIIYSVAETDGRLTISGLNNYKGKYVFALADNEDTNLLIAGNVDAYGLITLGKVKSDGSVTLKVWQETESDDYEKLENYKGNNSFGFCIYILDGESINIETFGNAAENKDFEKEEDILALNASIGFSAMLWAEGSFSAGLCTIGQGQWDLVGGVDDFTYTVNDTNGKLTITGLNNYKDQYVFADANNWVDEYTPFTSLLIADDVYASGLITLGKIDNSGEVTLKVWTETGSEPIILDNYAGNDAVGFCIYIFGGETISNIENFYEAMEGLDFEDIDELAIKGLKTRFGFSAMLWAEESFIAGEAVIDSEGWVVVAEVENNFYSMNDTNTSGRLTITNLPTDYRGKYVFGMAGNGDTDLLFTEGVTSAGLLSLGVIDSSGKVELKVWRESGSNPVKLSNYSGNDLVEFYLYILDKSEVNIGTFAEEDESGFKTMLWAYKNFTGGACTLSPDDWWDTGINAPWYTVNTTDGRLTINGLPGAYTGMYVFGYAGDQLIAKSVEENGDVTLGQIVNGSVTLNVWKITGESNVLLSNYSGNDSFDFGLFILDKAKVNNDTFEEDNESDIITMLWAYKNFTGGACTLSPDDWWDTGINAPWYTVNITEGRLTINGLPSAYTGMYVFGYAGDQLIAKSVEENGDVTLGQIVNGSVTQNVWKITGESNVLLSNYSGDDSFDFGIYILNKSKVNIGTFAEEDDSGFKTMLWAYKNFTGGVCTLSQDDWWDTVRNAPWYTVNTTSGILKITGLAAYKGMYIFATANNYIDDITPFTNLLIAEAVSEEGIITLGTVNNLGEAELKVWQETEPINIILGNYSGNDSVDFNIYILNKGTVYHVTFDEESDTGIITILYAEKSFAAGQCTLGPGEWEELN